MTKFRLYANYSYQKDPEILDDPDGTFPPGELGFQQTIVLMPDSVTMIDAFLEAHLSVIQVKHSGPMYWMQDSGAKQILIQWSMDHLA